MTLLFRCENESCGKVYSALSARVTVSMWGVDWDFCSGDCLKHWAVLHAQEVWTRVAKKIVKHGT